jgi:hypothetical protein
MPPGVVFGSAYDAVERRAIARAAPISLLIVILYLLKKVFNISTTI